LAKGGEALIKGKKAAGEVRTAEMGTLKTGKMMEQWGEFTIIYHNSPWNLTNGTGDLTRNMFVFFLCCAQRSQESPRFLRSQGMQRIVELGVSIITAEELWKV
jgi:hypothetical protein